MDSESRWPEPEEAPRPGRLAIARGVAFFLGAFSLLNVIAEMHRPGFDANLWWIDLTPCPPPLARSLLAAAGLILLHFAVVPQRQGLWKPARLLTVGLLLGCAVANTISYYRLILTSQITSQSTIPFSLYVVGCLAVIWIGIPVRTDGPRRAVRDGTLAAVAFTVCLIGFPMMQMSCFGRTDYRREADVVVVFGCRTNEAETPSDALLDRMETAIELYDAGLVDRLYLSGGPGDGERHETDVMQKFAIERGVPESAIIVDPYGNNTQQTVWNASEWCRENEAERVLAVCHPFELPRIKLAFRREGVEAFTVPSWDRHSQSDALSIGSREVWALWWYYLRPLAD